MILIVGPPGAGKSVQAKLLTEELGFTWLSTGKLLRENLSNDMLDAMERGDLIDDQTVQEILVKAFEGVPDDRTLLLDGYPRRDSQVQWFLEYVKTSQRNVRCIVHIKIALEIVLERLQSRGRLDDDPEVIRHRYEQYENEILPMLDHLAAVNIPILEIDGNKSIENVHTAIMAAVQGATYV